MWTALAALVIIGGLFWLVLRYAKAEVVKDVENAQANVNAEEERKRRELAEKQAVDESDKRVKEFDEKAADVHGVAGAIELLKEAARRTTR